MSVETPFYRSRRGEAMFASRHAEMREALKDGSYCAAFTVDAALQDFQIHAIGHASELDGIAGAAEGSGRVLVAVVALTPSGPKTVLADALDAAAIARMTELYIAHVNSVVSSTLQQLGAATVRPQSPVN